jgi:hypothetical protein
VGESFCRARSGTIEAKPPAACEPPRQASDLGGSQNSLGIWPIWVVGLGAGIALGACGAAAHAPMRAPAVTVTTLTVLAHQMATGADDSNVTVGDAVLTTQQAASTATSGSHVNANQPAYLIQLQGHFTALDASVPSGAKLPTGTYVIFVVDASSGTMTEWVSVTGKPTSSRWGPSSRCPCELATGPPARCALSRSYGV